MKIHYAAAIASLVAGIAVQANAQTGLPDEYNPDLLGYPIGAYLQAAHAVEQIALSDCAYRLKEEVEDRLDEFPTSDYAMREIRLHLDRSGQVEFDRLFQEDGTDLGKENAELMQGFIERLRDDGVVFPDICEVMISRHTKILVESRNSWMDAVWQNGRGDFFCTVKGAYELDATGTLVNSEKGSVYGRRVGNGFRVDRNTGYLSGAISNYWAMSDPPVVADYREAMESHGYVSTVMPTRTSNLGESQFRIKLLGSTYKPADALFFRYSSTSEIYTGTCIMIAPTECPSEKSGTWEYNSPPMVCD